MFVNWDGKKKRVDRLDGGRNFPFLLAEKFLSCANSTIPGGLELIPFSVLSDGRVEESGVIREVRSVSRFYFCIWINSVHEKVPVQFTFDKRRSNARLRPGEARGWSPNSKCVIFHFKVMYAQLTALMMDDYMVIMYPVKGPRPFGLDRIIMGEIHIYSWFWFDVA